MADTSPPADNGFDARRASLKLLRVVLIAVGLIAPFTLLDAIPAARQEMALGWSSREVPGQPAQRVTRTLSFANMAGLTPGDIVVAVDGQPASAALLEQLRREHLRGDTLALRVLRGGRELDIRVPMHVSSTAFVGYVWYRIVLALMSALVGLALLIRFGGHAPALALGGALILISPVSFPGWDPGPGGLRPVAQAAWQVLAAAYRFFFPAMLLHFLVLHVGGPRFLTSLRLWGAVYSALLLTLAVSTYGFTQPLAWTHPGVAADVRVASGFSFELLAFGGALFFLRHIAAHRMPLRWLEVSILVLLITGAPLSVALLVWGDRSEITEVFRLVKWLILLLPVATSVLYVVGGVQTRPSTWRVRTRVASSASLMLVVLYGVAVTGAAAIVLSTAEQPLGGTEAVLFAAIFLAAILFSPVLQWARDMVDRRVFSRWLEREALARAFVGRLATELHPNDVGHRIAGELPSILGIEDARLVLDEELARPWGESEMPSVTLWPRQRLLEEVRRERGGVTAWPITRADGMVIGALCYGRKLDGGGFDPPEERTLQTVAEGVASALRTAESYLLLRRTQQELAEAERIASLGALAGGLAHEVKNPLASLKMGMYLLGRDGVAPERVRRIQSDVQRIDDLVSGLLRFTRDDVPETRTALDLCGLVRESVHGMSGLAADRGTTVVETYPEQPVIIHGSREQLRLVVSNLLANALEAVGDEGAIAVAVRDRGGLAEIEIRDSGPGIPPELHERIFDWSFSTKPGGSGLGLALARREAERVGGRITLEPANGQGTVLRVLLPHSGR